jgi:hypothetical protein
MAKNSSARKRSRILGDLAMHTNARISGGRTALRLDYYDALQSRFYSHLQRCWQHRGGGVFGMPCLWGCMPCCFLRTPVCAALPVNAHQSRHTCHHRLALVVLVTAFDVGAVCGSAVQ